MGECGNNPGYMKLECAPTCQSCDQLDFDTRCPFDRNAPEAWEPGDLSHMFERLTMDPYYQQRYKPEILSSPKYYKPGHGVDNPWIVSLESFLTEDECEMLIRLGAERGYTRSLGLAEEADGSHASQATEMRTSKNTVREHKPTTRRGVTRHL